LFNSEASLAKYVGQSPFCEGVVLRHNGTESLLSRSFFKGDVAALLPQFEESSTLERPYEALSGDAWQLRHLPRDFDNRPEGLLLREAVLRPAPSFEVEPNRFTEIRSRGLNVLPLRSHIEFWAASYIPVALFRD